jgi:hypothetical protein
LYMPGIKRTRLGHVVPFRKSRAPEAIVFRDGMKLAKIISNARKFGFHQSILRADEQTSSTLECGL